MPLPIDPLIRLQGISKVFHTAEVETHALSGIDLEIRAGEYVAVAGPSGCGKTTLLSVLDLLDSPSEGSYVLAGEPVAGLSAAQRARVRSRAIGFIFQAFHLIGEGSGGPRSTRRWGGRPHVLLADEPTGNLDSRNGAQVMELPSELHRRGATIVMVTHDARYLAQVGRIVHLFDGRMVERGPLDREVA